MVTNAEAFASKFVQAMATKPLPFLVDGKEVAVVTADGRMTMAGGIPLAPAQAIDLRKWIKENFMAGGGGL